MRRLIFIFQLLFAFYVVYGQETGTFTDSRDGQTYNIVKIGNQIWMAENLNYNAVAGSYCYDDNNSNCLKYGRLYTWQVAQNVCPSGWHLPGDAEWEELAETVSISFGGYTKDRFGDWSDVGKHLKSNFGWKDSGDGLDNYDFSALPGGYRYGNEQYREVGYYAGFWSSTESDIYSAWLRLLYHDISGVARNEYTKAFGFSVRCIRDK